MNAMDAMVAGSSSPAHIAAIQRWQDSRAEAAPARLAAQARSGRGAALLRRLDRRPRAVAALAVLAGGLLLGAGAIPGAPFP